MRSYHDLPTIRHTIQQTVGFTIVYHYKSDPPEMEFANKMLVLVLPNEFRLNGGLKHGLDHDFTSRTRGEARKHEVNHGNIRG